MPKITDSNLKDSHIIINDSPEGGYAGQCLELPDAISEGDTEEDLIKKMTEAILLVLESIEKRAKEQKGKIATIPVRV